WEGRAGRRSGSEREAGLARIRGALTQRSCGVRALGRKEADNERLSAAAGLVPYAGRATFYKRVAFPQTDFG
nr:hypothetical protein [Tanacetum cinerariifolium]